MILKNVNAEEKDDGKAAATCGEDTYILKQSREHIRSEILKKYSWVVECTWI